MKLNSSTSCVFIISSLIETVWYDEMDERIIEKGGVAMKIDSIG
jgi:hypothetical protein